MNNFLSKLPKFNEIPTEYYLYAYLIGALNYNCYLSYQNSVNKLIIYRQLDGNKRTPDEMIDIHSEWEAVKVGAKEHFFSNVMYSLYWPLQIITNAIPYIVLKKQD